ncbi:MAG: hypothetical protein Q4D32_07925 [Eubacteriales bacterium]|nr:hypothetical protein [Eubacteriales bacterium]
MDQEKYWQQFTNSGKIEDYLAYRNVSGQDGYAQKTDRGKREHERERDSDWYDRTVITDKGI